MGHLITEANTAAATLLTQLFALRHQLGWVQQRRTEAGGT